MSLKQPSLRISLPYLLRIGKMNKQAVKSVDRHPISMSRF
jgi:hypothetical protein